MDAKNLKTLFVISATRKNKKGLVPIICRITYQGKRNPFATVQIPVILTTPFQ
jgi:hypothetical protein